MTGLPGGAFFVGVRLGGAWRVLGGFLAGANMRPKMAFAGWEGLAFERGGGGWMLGHAWGSGAWGWGGWGWACLGLDARAFGVGRGLLPFLLPFGALRQTHYLCNR